ncbi:hypothetical protein QE436_003311 [Pantoea anthophila]|nr:hypothetical protein [Pantoea anthophila]
MADRTLCGAIVAGHVLYESNNADRLSAIKMFALNGAEESIGWRAERRLLQFSHQFDQMLNCFLLVFAFCRQGHNGSLR